MPTAISSPATGTRLEGRGVVPDEAVPLDARGPAGGARPATRSGALAWIDRVGGGGAGRAVREPDRLVNVRWSRLRLRDRRLIDSHAPAQAVFPSPPSGTIRGSRMEQRRLRLGDILDDYCPRERRVTNHAVVAMIEDDVKQTRCTTCDAEHAYKGGKAPRRKKETTAALYKEVLAGMPEPTSRRPSSRRRHHEPRVSDVDADRISDVTDEPAPRRGRRLPAAPWPTSRSARDDGARIEEGPVHRPLIRAQLPRPEGHKDERPAARVHDSPAAPGATAASAAATRAKRSRRRRQWRQWRTAATATATAVALSGPRSRSRAQPAGRGGPSGGFRGGPAGSRQAVGSAHAEAPLLRRRPPSARHDLTRVPASTTARLRLLPRDRLDCRLLRDLTHLEAAMSMTDLHGKTRPDRRRRQQAIDLVGDRAGGVRGRRAARGDLSG